jgi:hypothetical protein
LEIPKPNGSDPNQGRKAELNPLLNPKLEQNLGRWAQVYFASPPEVRDQAVMDLLRELEGNASLESAGESSATPARSSVAAPEKLICPVCELENRPEQRFCGFCASPLRPRQSRPPAADYAAIETPSVLGLSSLPPADDSELQFLRDRPFRGEYYEPESSPHRGAYVIVGLIVVLAIAVYLKWPVLRQQLQSAWHRPAVVQSASTASSPSPPTSAPSQTASAPPVATAPPPEPVRQPSPGVVASKPPAQVASPAKEDAVQEETSGAAQPAAKLKAVSDSEASQPENGTQELILAQRYLQGARVPRDASVAARYLWKAVAKQNTQADLLLADLYARGDGVSKSCSQARMLLVAASEKGDPAAARKLRDFESGSCR